jgi:SAM-dependent methyltransferase
MSCSLCGADDWRPIPDPVLNRSITTAGNLLNESLSKAHCARCGLLQRINVRFVGDSDFYEERYADYYGRAGAEIYDSPRYAVMADWMCEALGNFTPGSILDVGCGAGWSMLATQKRFPAAAIQGIEPSRVNAERARWVGLPVEVDKIGAESRPAGTYDLVYANNVLQHVLSPVEFLTALRGYLSDQGLLVLICPDATRPSNEMLWCDHNHSFRPGHLRALASRAGFSVRTWRPNPDNITVLDKQLIVLAKDDESHASVAQADAPRLILDQLYQRRCGYIEAWRRVHEHLCAHTGGLGRILNFGASSWTWLLAGYCPEYWSRVDYCVVDRFGGQCLDKLVKPLEQVNSDPTEGLVLGVNPVSQQMFAERFQREGRRAVRWDGDVRC